MVSVSPELESAIEQIRDTLTGERRGRGKRRDGSLERFLTEAEDISRHLGRPELHCPVVGITKAGKSAFVNALLGAELLPSSNVPATANSTRVCHTPGLPPRLEIDGDVVAEGALAVREELVALGERSRQGRDSSTSVALHAEFPFLTHTPAAANQSLQFVLVDTPGVTEAGGDSLTQETLDSLRACDAAILALNYAELRTTAEESFLATCARARPDLFLRPGRNFFCVVTKIDLRNRHGINLRGVHRIVHDQLGGALGERLPTLRQSVWPVRGELALLARLIERGAADEGRLRDYKKLLFGSQGAEKPLGQRRLAQLVTTSVELSGIIPVEETLRDRVVGSSSVVRHAAVRGRLVNFLHRTSGWARRTRRWRLLKELSQILDRVKEANAPD